MLSVAAPAAAERYTAGSPGLGDELFPNAGNGGYDVTHYDLALDYDPVSDRLDGQAVITATATQDLDQFDLDLRDFADILKLEVDGHSARFAFEGEQELVITPRPKLKTGKIFQVEVQYVGVPPIIVDPDESIEGWVPTDDGAFVVNEPQGSPGWYPANDNPRDKATYDLAITVPEGRAALGNGVLVGQSTHDGKTTWRWRESRPMASYLVTATNGTFNLDFRTPDSGLPFYQAVDPRDAASMFDGTIYTRGAMTLQALRQKIGDADFFELLQTWYARHKYGNASTEDFTALAEEVSGRDLNDFFRVWLYTPGKPAPGSW